MATNYLGIPRGGNLVDVQASGATTGLAIELTYDTTKGTTKEDIVLALKNLTSYVLSNGITAGKTNVGADIPVL